jgi:hypothetical protein
MIHFAKAWAASLTIASLLAAQSDEAVRRGIAFMDRMADNPKVFADYGDDLLHFYAEVGAPKGHELALRWVKAHQSVPAHATPDELLALSTGAWSAEHLGVSAKGLREAVRRQARKYTSKEMLGFDMAHEPPATFDMWCDALITSFTGDLVSSKAVLRWLPAMRPYPSASDSVTYAITHTIYVLNGYGVYAMDRKCFEPEFEYLRGHLPNAIREQDPEVTGEFLDTLRAFGMTDSDPLIRQGVTFLLAKQNPDGSWGDPNESDIYTRYHSTWTAIDGLRQYHFKPARGCPASWRTR